MKKNPQSGLIPTRRYKSVRKMEQQVNADYHSARQKLSALQFMREQYYLLKGIKPARLNKTATKTETWK